MHKPGRTSLRLSLQFAFLYAILTAVIFVGAYWFTNFEVRGWLRGQMVSDLSILTDIYEKNGKDNLIQSVNIMAAVNFENSRILQLVSGDGSILAGNINELTEPITDGYVSVEKIQIEGAHSAEISGYWVSQNPIGPYILVQGTGNHVIAEVLEALGLTLVAGFLLILALGALVGVWVGRLTEERIETISGTLEKVSAGVLSARVPTRGGSNDDLSRVSVSINETLEKLENLVESQVQISNDIAHDLRTPLQRLRQRLEKMSNERTVDPQSAVAALEQTEDIISTFNALLRIAQIEAGDRRERFQQTDLGKLVTNVYEAFEPSAEEVGQSIELDAPPVPVFVWGDPDLLMQLISNLVENALRHTPAGTAIRIAVSGAADSATFTISDNGPGINPADRGKVFRRFYRGEKSRTSGGNGLGLSLCKAIAELHHATIRLTDNDPGLRIDIRFATNQK